MFVAERPITFAPATSEIILTIHPDGSIWRGELRLEDLNKLELETIVRELVAMIGSKG